MEKDLVELFDLVSSRQHAQELLLTGLVIALAENEVLPVKKAIAAMEFMTVFAFLTVSPKVAGDCLSMIERLRGCAEQRPREAFQFLIAMHADAGPQKRDALRTWLAQASAEEITEDLKELLDKLSPQAPSSRQPRKARGRKT